LTLEADDVGIVSLGNIDKEIDTRDSVRATGEVASVSVGDEFFGRVFNYNGDALDGGPPIKGVERRRIEAVAPGVVHRKSVHEALQTGIIVVDALVPIGRGQRELILGDRGTGKTAIAIDTIVASRVTNDESDPASLMKFIYVAAGQRKSSVVKLYQVLKQYGVMKNTAIIAATASDTAQQQLLGPYAGCALGEYIRDSGRHCLIIYDDLTKQAVAHRQVSLLLRRPPGREAYPGDVFYLHSRLLERAAKLSSKYGSGSLTAFPIVETQAGDVSGYIPTNVISITDGQIFLELALFCRGIRPALSVGISVSRVGSSAQIKAMRQVAGSLKLELAQYREVVVFAMFGSSRDASVRRTLRRGAQLTELLVQQQYQHLRVEEQVCLLYAGLNGYIENIAVSEVPKFKELYLNLLRSKHQNVLDTIRTTKVMSPESKSNLHNILTDFVPNSGLKIDAF
jgi:proton translocating ATP synthase F1 alpha subunit